MFAAAQSQRAKTVGQFDFAINHRYGGAAFRPNQNVEFRAANRAGHRRRPYLDLLRPVAAEEIGRAGFKIERRLARGRVRRFDFVRHQFAHAQDAQVRKPQRGTAAPARPQLITNIQLRASIC